MFNGRQSTPTPASSLRTLLGSSLSRHQARVIDSLGLPIESNPSPVERTTPRLLLRPEQLELEVAGPRPLLILRLLQQEATTGGESVAERIAFNIAAQASLDFLLSTESRHPNHLSVGPNAEAICTYDIPHEEISEEFICPLSGHIMSDPVYLENDTPKQGFERAWLITWLNEKEKHPLNRRDVSQVEVKAYVDLKHRIDDFMETIKNTKSCGHN